MPARRLRPLLIVVLASIAIAMVLVLRQTAEFDNDQGPAHAATRIVVSVQAKGGHPASDSQAGRLWAYCTHIPDEAISRTIHDGTIRGTLDPALGDDVQHRFVGCLEDFTIPGILGQVESVRAVPVAAGHSGTSDGSDHGAEGLRRSAPLH